MRYVWRAFKTGVRIALSGLYKLRSGLTCRVCHLGGASAFWERDMRHFGNWTEEDA